MKSVILQNLPLFTRPSCSLLPAYSYCRSYVKFLVFLVGVEIGMNGDGNFADRNPKMLQKLAESLDCQSPYYEPKHGV